MLTALSTGTQQEINKNMGFNELIGAGYIAVPLQRTLVSAGDGTFSAATTAQKTLTIPRNCRVLAFNSFATITGTGGGANTLTVVLRKNGKIINSNTIPCNETSGLGIGLAFYDNGGSLSGLELYQGDSFTLDLSVPSSAVSGYAAINVTYQEI